MNPIDFPGANWTFLKPQNMTDEECGPLRVKDTGRALISCWQPDADEMKRIAAGASVALWIWGRGMPPVSLEVNTALVPNVSPEDDLIALRKQLGELRIQVAEFRTAAEERDVLRAELGAARDRIRMLEVALGWGTPSPEANALRKLATAIVDTGECAEGTSMEYVTAHRLAASARSGLACLEWLDARAEPRPRTPTIRTRGKGRCGKCNKPTEQSHCRACGGMHWPALCWTCFHQEVPGPCRAPHCPEHTSTERSEHCLPVGEPK